MFAAGASSIQEFVPGVYRKFLALPTSIKSQVPRLHCKCCAFSRRQSVALKCKQLASQLWRAITKQFLRKGFLWMNKAAVGSTNPTKTRAVENVLRVLYPNVELIALDVPSGIRVQPIGDAETRRGALNRARAVLELTDADWGFGLEGGVIQTEFGVMTNAWCVVVARDGRIGVGGSANMLLPESIARRVLQEGRELGDAMDEYANAQDVKRGKGAIGILTRGLLDRQGAYEYIVKLALARMMWEETL